MKGLNGAAFLYSKLMPGTTKILDISAIPGRIYFRPD
jgi:hypothetical protein